MKRFLSVSLLFIMCTSLSGCRLTTPYDTKLLLSLVIMGLIIVLFIVLAMHSNILRDEVNDADAFNENAVKIQQQQKTRIAVNKNPFSLSKVQFGVWTVIISCAYVYLSLCKGDCSDTPINKTALVLMGISCGLAAASTIIDKREINDNRPRHQNTPSQGFFVDILSDDNGISIHRFQNLVWTLIAVIIYLYKISEIKTGCLLPELSDTLLALTGLSSATYLVLRSKENDPPAEDTSSPNPTASQIDSTVTAEKNGVLTN